MQNLKCQTLILKFQLDNLVDPAVKAFVHSLKRSVCSFLQSAQAHLLFMTGRYSGSRLPGREVGNRDHDDSWIRRHLPCHRPRQMHRRRCDHLRYPPHRPARCYRWFQVPARLHGRGGPRVRRRMNNELNFPPNFERLVLGCIDADFCK